MEFARIRSAVEAIPGSIALFPARRVRVCDQMRTIYCRYIAAAKPGVNSSMWGSMGESPQISKQTCHSTMGDRRC